MPKIGGTASEGVQAVVLALRILEFLARQRRPVGVTALAQALGTTKSRIHRHLRTLQQQGYILQSEETERYRIGTRLITLGRAVAETFDLAAAAHEPMRALRDSLGHAVVVSAIERDGVRVLAAVTGTSAIEIGVKRGSLLPFHCSAQGKAALAFADADLVNEVLAAPLPRMTPRTITTPDGLRSELDRIRTRGWAVAPNEVIIGLNTLAAPIFEAGGSVLGAIGAVDSIQFIGEEPSAAQQAAVLAAARQISEALGFRPGGSAGQADHPEAGATTV